ncbi:hypothetical protein MUB04_14905 [Acinetobacter indicus]|uniref:hypothetical protein n=1 Tax=Acinetobacter TaxID=469 RepID=UPI0015D2E614|nr:MULTISPECIES: hypothetical protein [Acinetobacter]MCP0917823.1 hypothetical protein [Acinetobacter indicus]
MSNNNTINLAQLGFGKLSDHIEKTIQSPHSSNVWLSLLPPNLQEKLDLVHCESDEDMLMRHYLYSANNWFPFVVGHTLTACTHAMEVKLTNNIKNEHDVEQWKSAVREALEHMEACYKANSLTKLKKLNKDWRVSVFANTKAKAVAA